jgi:hypothetical protein
VTSATLAYAGEVGIGSVLRVSGMSITAAGFGYTVGAGASFNGSLTVAVGSASVFPDGPVSAEATGITVTVDLSAGHEGELSFSALTFAFTLAGVLEVDAANVSIDTDPAPGGLVRFARSKHLPDLRDHRRSGPRRLRRPRSSRLQRLRQIVVLPTPGFSPFTAAGMRG